MGLFRTEWILDRFDSPKPYTDALRALEGKPLTVRLLDLGGDKAEVSALPEANPFLGCRGIRYLLKKPELLKAQLSAILEALAICGPSGAKQDPDSCRDENTSGDRQDPGPLQILVPMVTGTEEVKAVRDCMQESLQELEQRGIRLPVLPRIGAMVETPAAALIADLLAKEADFLSIGSNDLTGYLLCCDRGNPAVAPMYSWYHPAVLRALQNLIRTCRENKTPLSICGEAAADPRMLPVLLGLGLRSFSVNISSVTTLRNNLQKWRISEACSLTDTLLGFSTEEEIHTYLDKNIPK